jgi:hypothetical protein
MFPVNHRITGFRGAKRFDLGPAIASLVGWSTTVFLCPCGVQSPSAAAVPNQPDSGGTKVIFYQPQELQPYVSYLQDHAQPPVGI